MDSESTRPAVRKRGNDQVWEGLCRGWLMVAYKADRRILCGLTRGDVQKKLASADVRRLNAVVHHALKDAVHWGYLPRNAPEAVDPSSIPHRKLVIPTAAELHQLLAASRMAAADPLPSLWLVSIYSAVRQGAPLSLQWTDLDRCTLLLRTPHNGGPAYDDPPTVQSRRNLPLDAPAIDALQEQRTWQLADHLRLGLDYAMGNLVFASSLSAARARQRPARLEDGIALCRAANIRAHA